MTKKHYGLLTVRADEHTKDRLGDLAYFMSKKLSRNVTMKEALATSIEQSIRLYSGAEPSYALQLQEAETTLQRLEGMCGKMCDDAIADYFSRKREQEKRCTEDES